MKELGRDLPADPAAIAQEIVRVAGRSDISEEVVRFRAHLAHWTVLTRVATSRAGASSISCSRK